MADDGLPEGVAAVVVAAVARQEGEVDADSCGEDAEGDGVGGIGGEEERGDDEAADEDRRDGEGAARGGAPAGGDPPGGCGDGDEQGEAEGAEAEGAGVSAGVDQGGDDPDGEGGEGRAAGGEGPEARAVEAWPRRVVPGSVARARATRARTTSTMRKRVSGGLSARLGPARGKRPTRPRPAAKRARPACRWSTEAAKANMRLITTETSSAHSGAAPPSCAYHQPTRATGAGAAAKRAPRAPALSRIGPRVHESTVGYHEPQSRASGRLRRAAAIRSMAARTTWTPRRIGSPWDLGGAFGR